MKFNVTELVYFRRNLLLYMPNFFFVLKVSAFRKISFFPYDSSHVSFCQLCFFFSHRQGFVSFAPL